MERRADNHYQLWLCKDEHSVELNIAVLCCAHSSAFAETSGVSCCILKERSPGTCCIASCSLVKSPRTCCFTKLAMACCGECNEFFHVCVDSRCPKGGSLRNGLRSFSNWSVWRRTEETGRDSQAQSAGRLQTAFLVSQWSLYPSKGGSVLHFSRGGGG